MGVISIPRARPTGRRAAKGAEAPPLAARLQEHENLDSEDRDRSAARWNTHFRFALKTGLRYSAHSNDKLQPQKGDISIELKMGTLLSSLDTGDLSACI